MFWRCHWTQPLSAQAVVYERKLTAHASAQALKSNPALAPKDVKISSNYITRFGQVALTEALDMVYEMGGQRMNTIHF